MIRKFLSLTFILCTILSAFVPVNQVYATYYGETPTNLGSGVFEVKFLQTGTWVIPKHVKSDEVTVLVVAGGAGGGYSGKSGTSGNRNFSGGGGAGGLIYVGGYDISEYSVSMAVTVGAGGAGGVSGSSEYRIGDNGGNSVFGGLTATGGGGGGMCGGSGVQGGSGGGGGGYYQWDYDQWDHWFGASGTQPSTNDGYAGSGFGNDGAASSGTGSHNPSAARGGGGGGAGGNANTYNGGAGRTYWSATYAVGGQGGYTGPTAGGANTGDGGDGILNIDTPGKAGGSGIVIIRYTADLPTVDTDAATNVEETTATLNAEITCLGETTVTKRGFEWDINSGTPYASNWYETGTFGLGVYNHGITGLSEGQTHYFRAYAENTAGTDYGSEDAFLTKPLEPTSFIAIPTGGGLNASLSWTKGSGADKTLIRYKIGSYPTSKTDGTQLYFGTDSSYVHEDPGAGTYFYRSWSYAQDVGESLEQYSDGYASANVFLEPGLVAWYQPNTMVLGTALTDRSGTDNHGVITWGSNPSGVTATLGSLVAEPTGVTIEDDGDGYREVIYDVETSDWFREPDVGAKLAVHPLRPLVTIMSNSTTVTEVQAWRFLGLAVLLLVTVGSAVSVRGHLLIAGLACGGTIALLAQQTIWPGWTLVFMIPAIIAGLIAERTPSIG